MQLAIVGLWWLVALACAIALVVAARPRHHAERYRTQVFVKSVEDLTTDDTMRSHPYEVTILLPSTDPKDAGRNVYHQLSCNPEDLNTGRARWAARYRQTLPAWVSVADPRDIIFTRANNWQAQPIIYAVFVMVAQFVMTGACIIHLRLVGQEDPWFVFMFPPTIGALTFLCCLGVMRFFQFLTLWIRLASKPITVPATITGVRQNSATAHGHANGYEVSLAWAPLGMPAQFSTVHVSSTRRRTRILLQKLIGVQLEEAAQGKQRVDTAPPPQARTSVSQLSTPQGPTTVKITALPATDPRFDPRPPKVRLAAEKARAKQEATLLAQREAFERSTAKARIEDARRAELGDADNSLEELAKAGPMAWYFPLNTSRVNLVGLGSTPGGRPAIIWRALAWIVLAIAAGAGSLYLGFFHPEVMFPIHNTPAPENLPLGGWE